MNKNLFKWFSVFVIAIMIVGSLDLVSGSNAPAPVMTKVAQIGGAKLVSASSDCDSDDCCEDDDADSAIGTNHGDPRCTPVPEPTEIEDTPTDEPTIEAPTNTLPAPTISNTPVFTMTVVIPPTATPTAISETATATKASESTATPQSSLTPQPSDTPEPTATASPTPPTPPTKVVEDNDEEESDGPTIKRAAATKLIPVTSSAPVCSVCFTGFVFVADSDTDLAWIEEVTPKEVDFTLQISAQAGDVWVADLVNFAAQHGASVTLVWTEIGDEHWIATATSDLHDQGITCINFAFTANENPSWIPEAMVISQDYLK